MYPAEIKKNKLSPRLRELIKNTEEGFSPVYVNFHANGDVTLDGEFDISSLEEVIAILHQIEIEGADK